jgi:hypothetical protein
VGKNDKLLRSTTRGSHHIFRKRSIEEKINLQRDGDKAKVYQVRQVRSILLKHKMGGGNNGKVRSDPLLE